TASGSPSLSFSPRSSTANEDQSPHSLEYPNTNSRRMSGSWTDLSGDAFAAEQKPFNYGNWEEWMRWDGAAQEASPKHPQQQQQQQQQKTSSPFIKQEAGSPGIGSQATSNAQASQGLTAYGQASSQAELASLPAMDGNNFTFGEGRNHDGVFQFGDGMVSPPVTSAPQNGFDALAWSQPPQMDPAMGNTISPLTLEEQQHLRNIAFPSHTSSFQQSPASTSETRQSSSSSPEPRQQNNNKKRKPTTEEEDQIEPPVDTKNGKQPPVKKTAHNMIEKRYRTNLNDKIAALRDSVPSLRVMSRSAQGNGDDEDDPEDLEGLTPAHKLNKATVLSKATEYIRHLEKRNKRLGDENVALKIRLNAFEKLAMTGSIGVNNGGVPSNGMRYQGDPFAEAAAHSQTGTQGVPQGLIQVPESMRRLHAGQVQQHYANSQTGYQNYPPGPGRQADSNQQNGRRGGGGVMSKLMVGSLAGLMVVEGLNAREQKADQPSGRGLFALPTEIVGSLLGHGGSTPGFGSDVFAAQRFFPLLKVFMVFGAIVYIIAPLLFGAHNRKGKKCAPASRLAAAPSLASPLEVRRKAWLTAIQTVWVPQRNFGVELAALGLKTAKLGIRNLIGWHGYSLLTGATEEHEMARVKAWEIALDAQLAGGDAEISKSRLLLTLLASDTLPQTPARLMLRALHIRVLLLQLAHAGYGGWYMFEEVAARVARSQWNEARRLRKSMLATALKEPDCTEVLPLHLAELLNLDCEEVMVDSAVRRASNLAFNRPTTENTNGSDAGMDSVVDDFAIRSPLDALAAWSSCLVLDKVLTTVLETENFDEVETGLDRAYKIAPPSSYTQIRARVAKAVLSKQHRGANISAVVQALPAGSQAAVHGTVSTNDSIFINSPTSVLSTPDISLALRCAMSLALYRGTSPVSNTNLSASKIFNSLYPNPSHMSLLGFVAAYGLLNIFTCDDRMASETAQGLETMAGALRVWIGSDAGRRSGLRKQTRARIVDECLCISRKVVGMRAIDEDDAGYASWSEGEIDNC
ncbi:MAG: hypothetical protein M1819_005798, partial [Sarea resinae]